MGVVCGTVLDRPCRLVTPLSHLLLPPLKPASAQFGPVLTLVTPPARTILHHTPTRPLTGPTDGINPSVSTPFPHTGTQGYCSLYRIKEINTEQQETIEANFSIMSTRGGHMWLKWSRSGWRQRKIVDYFTFLWNVTVTSRPHANSWWKYKNIVRTSYFKATAKKYFPGVENIHCLLYMKALQAFRN